MLASSKVVPGRQSSSREDLTASLTKQLNPSASAAVPTAPTDAEKRAIRAIDQGALVAITLKEARREKRRHRAAARWGTVLSPLPTQARTTLPEFPCPRLIVRGSFPSLGSQRLSVRHAREVELQPSRQHFRRQQDDSLPNLNVIIYSS